MVRSRQSYKIRRYYIPPNIRISAGDIKSIMPSLITLARTFRHTHPTARVVSLGQSPAWLVKIMEIMDTKSTNIDEKYIYMPFSGNITIKNYHTSTYSYNIELQTVSQTFKKTMQNRGLSPRQIIDNNKNGVPTIILEYIYTGNGLASFIFILSKWAIEDNINVNELYTALQFHVMGLLKSSA